MTNMNELTRQQVYAAPALTPNEVTQYSTAADIANRTLSKVIFECKVGASILAIADASDVCLKRELADVYKNATDKSICFPTCLNINNIVGSFAPAGKDDYQLQAGDIVKLELGVQIEGCHAVVGHTVVVNPDPSRPLIGRGADAICAAYYASEVAAKMIQPGATSGAVTEAIQAVAACFNVNPVEHVLTSNMKKYVIDGDRIVLNKLSLNTGAQNFEFQLNEIYCVDIAMSTGTGEPKPYETAKVYRRNVSKNVGLKLQSARNILNEVKKNFPVSPFSRREFEGTRNILGLKECIDKEMLVEYPVLAEKNGSLVARFKFTLLLLPTGTTRITMGEGLPYVHSEYGINDNGLKQIMEMTAPKTRVAKILKDQQHTGLFSTY